MIEGILESDLIYFQQALQGFKFLTLSYIIIGLANRYVFEFNTFEYNHLMTFLDS